MGRKAVWLFDQGAPGESRDYVQGSRRWIHEGFRGQLESLLEHELARHNGMRRLVGEYHPTGAGGELDGQLRRVLLIIQVGSAQVV